MRSSTIAKITSNGKTRYCSECAAGGNKEVAIIAVSYTNSRGRHVRNKHVCVAHTEIICQDFTNVKEEVLLPRNVEEAEEHICVMPPTLLQIANGKRKDIPTLDSRDALQRAAGILSGKEVSWLR